jgi:anti-sigma B factor antagonist
MPEASFSIAVVSSVPVVAAPEEIDITNVARLRAALLDAAARDSGTLVVDMARTEFCDSAGLNALVRAHQRAQAQGGEVRLVISGAHVRRIFAITGIDRMIPSFASLDEALAHAPAAAAPPPAPASDPGQ